MNSKNLKLSLILLLVFCVTTLNAENLTITLNSNDYFISTNEAGVSIIEMKDFGSTTTPGEPQLPSKTILMALPPVATVQSVNISSNSTIKFEKKYRIKPNDLVMTGEATEGDSYLSVNTIAKNEWQSNYESAYNSNQLYPQAVGEYLGQGHWRKYTYVRVKYCPFQYRPLTNELIFHNSCTVSIDYSQASPTSEEWAAYLKMSADNVLDDVISKNIINFDGAQSWYQADEMSTLQAQMNEKYDYVIIIENETVRQHVQSLKTWKEKIGHSVKVVTVDSISENFTGQDLPKKIWKFLQQNYSIESWGIRYVLLAGYIDVIPIRFLFPSDKGWAYASDYYYAKLSTT